MLIKSTYKVTKRLQIDRIRMVTPWVPGISMKKTHFEANGKDKEYRILLREYPGGNDSDERDKSSKRRGNS